MKGPTDPSKVINNRLHILKLSMVAIVDRKVEILGWLHMYIYNTIFNAILFVIFILQCSVALFFLYALILYVIYILYKIYHYSNILIIVFIKFFLFIRSYLLITSSRELYGERTSRSSCLTIYLSISLSSP